jgi:hypothetical protein
MMAGPQIMSAILFVTTPKPVNVSLAFISGAAIGVAGGVCITFLIATLLGNNVSLGSSSSNSSKGTVIQLVLVGLLIALMIKNYLGRATAEPPKWLGKLMDAEPTTAFKAGLLLLTIFPSDAVILFTVGVHLTQGNHSLVDALPFVGVTILIAALPFLSYMAFRRAASRAMPAVRDWMNTKSWLVNIIVFGIFVVLILS